MDENQTAQTAPRFTPSPPAASDALPPSGSVEGLGPESRHSLVRAALRHTATWTDRVVGDLRTDHAGETGAVFIYRGILKVSRDPAVCAFARAHLATESEHLALMEALLAPTDRSRLLPIWRVAGFLTGAIPALFGNRAVFRTIESVETFVDQHYQEQIDHLTAIAPDSPLLAVLRACQADEVHHRDEAAALAQAAPPLPRPLEGLIGAWAWVVGFGSAQAVHAARRI